MLRCTRVDGSSMKSCLPWAVEAAITSKTGLPLRARLTRQGTLEIKAATTGEAAAIMTVTHIQQHQVTITANTSRSQGSIRAPELDEFDEDVLREEFAPPPPRE